MALPASESRRLSPWLRISFAIRRQAEGILASGSTDTVLVVHAQRFSQFAPNDQIKYFAHAGFNLEWEIPYGMTYNALAAMMSQAYMAYTGTTIRGVAHVVACRKWANLQAQCNVLYEDRYC